MEPPHSSNTMSFALATLFAVSSTFLSIFAAFWLAYHDKSPWIWCWFLIIAPFVATKIKTSTGVKTGDKTSGKTEG